MNHQKYAILFLALSVIALSVLVPGGPIETRDFSHLIPILAWGFNTFLVCLVILSIFLLYFMIKKEGGFCGHDV